MTTVESLTSVTQEAYNQAEALVINLVRSAYPNIDLRRGTVLRDLLIRPAASFYAMESARYDHLQSMRSLQLMAANPDNVTADDVNAILANFSVTQRVGTKAYGTLLVRVAYARTYSITTDLQFTTLDGHAYAPEQAYLISADPDVTDARQLELHTSEDGASYFFLLPVTAVLEGAQYQIDEGTALDVDGVLDGFISCEAADSFTGGTDPETLQGVIDRLPVAISHRGLESRTSIEALLRDPDGGNFGSVLQAISVQGYGDTAQLRDKHNLFGVAVGGRVDIYARTFFQPAIVTLEKRGTLISPNTYSISIDQTEAPGFYAVKTVTDAENTLSPALVFGVLPSIGSYDVTDVRSNVNVATTFHDFDAANAVVETAYTVWQTATLVVNDVGAADSATKLFKVQLYVAPQLQAMQTYVDSSTVRNVKADYVVRCPLIVLTGVRACVTPKSRVSALDVSAMQSAVADYINGRSFVDKLTASEIISVLHGFQIQRVDLSNDPNTGFEISSCVRDASGAIHRLRGRDINLLQIDLPSVLLTPNTCVFGAEPNDINIAVADE